MYKFFIRPFFFLFSAEKAHHLSMRLLKGSLAIPGAKFIFNALFNKKHTNLTREVMGLTFNNPVGLAAGFDKDAKYVEELSHLGFGFIEIGTLTPKPQPGNPQPRLFRLKADEALLNRMGFNNGGVEAAVQRLKSINPNVIIGGNIGKNKVTSNEDAAHDYLHSFEALFNVVDYFVVNVSSPNTPNLRALQDKEPLKKLLDQVQLANNVKNKPKPILLKIAPDLTEEQIEDIVEIVKSTKLAGVVATNTTISRDELGYTKDEALSIGNGGVSGAPLTYHATEIIKLLRTKLGNKAVIIGVGGIMTPQDAKDKLEAGADLIQVFTGFIYNGPSFVKHINKAIMNFKTL
ncbi:MAG: quinone-dependent dihydroorotate dehydrogenase [Cyclobacteriaceae bacterium]|nr:quinone-dependent dihydroorotate dehydrogenase [Cyclobacteriaceae bacterium]